MSALLIAKLVLAAIVVLTVAALLALAAKASAFREEERSFPQTDESGR